jgi:hypothetical protein
MGKVIRLDPSNPQPHLHLTQAFQGLGDKDNATKEAAVFKELNGQRMVLRDHEGGRELHEK